MENRKITFTEYCKAKAIVAEYELERIDNARFCKSCQDEVTGTQCGSCGNPCLSTSDTFSFQEMMEHEMKISEYEANRAKNKSATKQLAYEEYVNQCGTQPHVSFEVWEKHYDDGTEYLLDEESALRNGNKEPNYERPGH